MSHPRPFVARLLFDHSLLLVAGTLTALVWANLDGQSYSQVAHPLHFWVNDVGMVFFFALAAKEVFEATLPGGSLSSWRNAASPLAAAMGGMVAPALIYSALVGTMGPTDLARGWAIPCATDIAFSAMVARAIFPVRHPAIPFLLLLAIADDALGLIILAFFYPSAPLSFTWVLMLMTAALVVAMWLRRRQIQSFWPYVVGAGSFSWGALYLGGLHPALALVPVVPFMPHSARDLGIFDPGEDSRVDTLNKFEHWWAAPVQVILMLFGFANAGVAFESIGAGTYYVLAALLIGKPVGVLLMTGLAGLAGARMPTGLKVADVLVVGVIASIGFTVSLFFATAAFPSGTALAETKMGAVLSFAAAPLAFAVAWLRKRLARARTGTYPRRS
jgi:NhaA family Na+:H+ antiporter